MSADDIIGLVAATGLVIYLIVCLLHPEKF
ncbi:K(+)-transporting ATPase subunit F [Streptomyces sp. NBC_01525]